MPGRRMRRCNGAMSWASCTGVPISVKDLELTKGVRTTMGSAIFRGPGARDRLDSSRTGESRRRDHPGQDQYARIRPVGNHREPGERAVPQPLEYELHPWRQQRRRRCRADRGFVHPGHRQRRGRQHPDSFQLQRSDRDQTVPRPGAPVRRLRGAGRQPFFAKRPT